MEPRFVVRVGKWGCYFYDTVLAKDMTLEETAAFMNEAEEIRPHLRKIAKHIWNCLKCSDCAELDWLDEFYEEETRDDA